MATLKRHTGSAFEYVGMPVNVGMSPQTLAYVEMPANATTSGTTELTLLSANFVVPEGRRIRATYHSFDVSHTVAGDIFNMRMRLNGVMLNASRHRVPTNDVGGRDWATVFTPAAGMHTLTVTAQRESGSGTETHNSQAADLRAYLIIEDITGSTLPYQPASVPVGVLAQSSITSNQSGITAEVDVVGLSVNVSVPSGRTLRISAQVRHNQTTANAQDILYLYRDGVIIQLVTAVWNTSQSTINLEAFDSPSAGAHVYKIRAQASSGSMTVAASATNPGFITVQDTTPTPAPSSGAPSSTLGYAALTTSQTGITTETDVNDLSVTVTVPAGRRLKISSGMGLQSTVAGDYAFMRLTEDGNNISYSQIITGASVQNTDSVAVVTPSAGSHTYKARAARTGSAAGTISVVAATTNPAYLLVEDITGTTMYAPETTVTDFYYNTTISNGSSTSLVDFLTQNVVGSLPYNYTMIVTAYVNCGFQGALNFLSLQVRDEAGANINYKTTVLGTDWVIRQEPVTNHRSISPIFGKKDYNAGATCGFRLAYKVDTSNTWADVTVHVKLVPR